ncbi:MAG: hypothetical protein ACYCO3_01810 [Mycobacteriales bacterium]
MSVASTRGPAGQEDSVTVSGSWEWVNVSYPIPDPGPKPGPDITVVPDITAPPAGTGLFECQATATPGAIATGITACYVVGSDGSTYSASSQAAPGPVDATANGAFSGDPLASYTVCFEAEAVFADGSYVQSQLSCY